MTGSAPQRRLGLGGFTLLLSLVVVLMLAALFATEQLLSRTASDHATTDAGYTAVRIEHAAMGIGQPLDRASLEAVLREEAPAGREWIVVFTGTDTIRIGEHQARMTEGRVATAVVTLPDGARWVVATRHARSGRLFRYGLWFIEALTIVLLGLAVQRERQEAQRVAERSAELERLSTELLRANRMKSEFLANVSHELRTPLNAIVGFVELLKDGVYGDLSPRQVSPVDRIAVSATHLRHLVDQVLDIAKIAAGRVEMHPESIALRGFVFNVVSELEALIAERGLSLSINVPAGLPRLLTDPTHLRQILINLIGNAVKHTAAGSIVVRARSTGSQPGRPTPDDPNLGSRSPDPQRAWIALQVVDTGVGIAEADRERIFDEFEQATAGPRLDAGSRGTGLGLAISRRLARLLGGDITVESQLGRGSTFTVWLPEEEAPTMKPAATSVATTS